MAEVEGPTHNDELDEYIKPLEIQPSKQPEKTVDLRNACLKATEILEFARRIKRISRGFDRKVQIEVGKMKNDPIEILAGRIVDTDQNDWEKSPVLYTAIAVIIARHSRETILKSEAGKII
ncbi:MAG: hypothetical protein Athens101428_195 [Candidatus Berkelbacteria bacterium Athens1014_28]|uniref:Uncharacterized protein n=1 Tax=Candidatus Berkelbacteria bacterium Athens1014_28 TaxID=2017145 RepID=A0A554LP82_9BACT|nr:MAG: hypothetical protein Athens101428_195 [Candidatus Berkelbacteria bacterium Athens1014_28]